MRKIGLVAVAVLALFALTFISVSPASAWWHRGWQPYYPWSWGPRIIIPIPLPAPVYPYPVYPQPPCQQIWVQGQWVWNGYQYVWNPGYWQTVCQ